jgi:osmotically-inducible protein OsmY
MHYSNGSLTALTSVLVACGVVACSTTPPRTTAERAADAELADRVQAALLADPDIYARHIDVKVDRGVVHLGGYVWEPDDFQTARRDASSVPGVNTVIAQMDLMRGGLSGTSR